MIPSARVELVSDFLQILKNNDQTFAALFASPAMQALHSELANILPTSDAKSYYLEKGTLENS